MLETKAKDIAIKYHATMIDINRSLYIAGLVKEDLAWRVAWKHIMAIIEILSRSTGKAPEELLAMWETYEGD